LRSAFKVQRKRRIQVSHLMTSSLIYGAICGYLLVLIFVALVAYHRKQQASKDGDRLRAHFGGSFGAPVLVLTTFSTVYSGFTVTGIPSESYRKGFISLRWVGATIVIVLGMMIYYPRLRRLAVARSYSSPNDFIKDRFQTKRLQILIAVCGVVPMVLYITAQIIAFAAMLSGLTNDVMPKWACMVMFGAIILSLEKVGGMNSVVLTDVVQSTIMIISFLAVPFALGAHFGYLGEFAAKDCDSLQWMTSAAEMPMTCPMNGYSTPPTGCVPSGCLAAVKPSFYKYPDHSDQATIFWFFVNMLAAPLQPHMIHRAYIASSDRALRIMMAVMLVAPFLAQPPGIVIGLTKAAFELGWPASDRDVTAFTAVGNQLLDTGSFEYVLVTVMNCATMAAIMSTADSALMGASNVLSVDIFKGVLFPAASEQRTVRFGEVCSLVMVAASIIMGLFLSVRQFGSMIIFQNGLLMQLAPAFGLGMYFDVAERPVASGIVTGLLALVILAGTGNPLDPYVPAVNVAMLVNFATVALVQMLAPGSGPVAESNTKIYLKDSQIAVHTGQVDQAHETVAPEAISDLNRQDLSPSTHQLDTKEIHEVMSASKEPCKVMMCLMLVVLMTSIPWYQSPGSSAPPVAAGLPMWGLIQVCFFVVAMMMGLGIIWFWQPGSLSSSLSSSQSSSESSSLSQDKGAGTQSPASSNAGHHVDSDKDVSVNVAELPVLLANPRLHVCK